MRYLFLLFILMPLTSHARFLFQYGLNYSSETDNSQAGEYEKTRVFHKAFLGAGVNSRRTFFFGWGINSWSSSISKGESDEDTYSLLEMGPRIVWFKNENYNLFFTAEWNPYARGSREKEQISREIQGSSFGLGVGYRFKLSRLVGLGASLNYHTLSLNEEKIETTESNISSSVNNIMPMLELSIITR